MTPEFGAASQLEKIDMLDFADAVVINKFERRGAEDALRDVRRQLARNRELFGADPESLPVFGTIASRFNDDGVTALYQHLRVRAGRARAARRRRPAARRWRAGPARRWRRSCRPTARATWPRSPRPCEPTTPPPRSRCRRPASCSSSSPPATCWPTAGLPRTTSTPRSTDAQARRRRRDPGAARRVGRHRRRAGGGSGTGVAVGQRRPPGRAPPLRGRRRAAPLPPLGERAGAVPVHRRGVPAQARGRGPGAHVRRRGRRLPHQPALPPAQRGPARHPPVHRVRLGHPLRLRPRRAARHLRQGRQLRRVDRHARRHAGALRRVRPHRPDHVGVDDDQRTGAHDPRHVPEHGDRPAPGARAGRGAAPGAGHRAGRHPQGGPGPEHLHLLHRVLARGDGRHPGVVRRARGAQLLQRLDQRLPHRRGRREPHLAARLHARQRLHLRGELPGARPGHRRLRAEPLVLLLQRHGPRVRGARPRRPPHLGRGDARPLRRQRARARS